MKALIVDDEMPARLALRKILEKHCPEVEVAGEATNIADAVKEIRRLNPEVVFLDIELPGISGLRLLDFFNPEEVEFEIIFVTAFDQYALNALKMAAIDYLLKPVAPEELKEAISKLSTRQKRNDAHERMAAFSENMRSGPQTIGLPVSDGLRFIPIRDIAYVCAEGAYARVYQRNGDAILVSKTLKEFEPLLGPPDFFRIHRSSIVNLNSMQRYVTEDGGYLVMNDERKLSLSRHRREAFLKALANRRL